MASREASTGWSAAWRLKASRVAATAAASSASFARGSSAAAAITRPMSPSALHHTCMAAAIAFSLMIDLRVKYVSLNLEICACNSNTNVIVPAAVQLMLAGCLTHWPTVPLWPHIAAVALSMFGWRAPELLNPSGDWLGMRSHADAASLM